MERVLDRARSYVGMRSRPLRDNDFGKQAGYGGFPWDGSFLQTVLREEGLTAGVSLTASTAALAFFVRTNRLFTTPKTGDIVFFHFAASLQEPFAQPHVGLVSDARDWKRNRSFRSIEGEVSPGTPRGHGESDGVYERVRYETDVLAFVRPQYRKMGPTATPEDAPILRPSQFHQGTRHTQAVVTLQTALHAAVDASGFARGKFDSQTRAAVRRLQREAGIADGVGAVDVKTLRALSQMTGGHYFRVRE